MAHIGYNNHANGTLGDTRVCCGQVEPPGVKALPSIPFARMGLIFLFMQSNTIYSAKFQGSKFSNNTTNKQIIKHIL